MWYFSHPFDYQIPCYFLAQLSLLGGSPEILEFTLCPKFQGENTNFPRTLWITCKAATKKRFTRGFSHVDPQLPSCLLLNLTL
jgi:hypothetical protein